jgi:hypothetical protein
MFVLKHSIHSNNHYAYKYVNEVTKGQKVMKTGYKWKFEHCSKIPCQIVDLWILMFVMHENAREDATDGFEIHFRPLMPNMTSW